MTESGVASSSALGTWRRPARRTATARPPYRPGTAPVTRVAATSNAAQRTGRPAGAAHSRDAIQPGPGSPRGRAALWAAPPAPVAPGTPPALEWSPVSEEPLLISDVQARVVAELARIAPVTDELGRRFAAAGEEIALVGGPVRDAMLGRLHNDLDFTTSARPEVTERLLKGWADATWDIGRAFGTIGCRRGEWQVEITTYRSEAYDAASRKPAVQVRRLARRRPGPPRLHRELDGALAARRSSSRTPSAASSTSPTRCCAPRGGPRTPSPTTRCG